MSKCKCAFITVIEKVFFGSLKGIKYLQNIMQAMNFVTAKSWRSVERRTFSCSSVLMGGVKARKHLFNWHLSIISVTDSQLLCPLIRIRHHYHDISSFFSIFAYLKQLNIFELFNTISPSVVTHFYNTLLYKIGNYIFDIVFKT